MKRRLTSVFGLLCAVSLVGSCAPLGQHELTVVGRDYALEAPDVVPAGPTTIRYRSEGKVQHELIVVRLKSNTPVAAVVAAMKADSGDKTLEDPGAGVLFAGPGEANGIGLDIDLLAGRAYLFLCRFKDANDKPAHDQLGMYKLVTAR